MRRAKYRGGAIIRGVEAAKLTLDPQAEEAVIVALAMAHDPGQIGIVVCDDDAAACMWLDLDAAIPKLRALGGQDAWTDELRTMRRDLEIVVVRQTNGDLVRLVRHPIVKGGAA
jgi:hypothetical protein